MSHCVQSGHCQPGAQSAGCLTFKSAAYQRSQRDALEDHGSTKCHTVVVESEHRATVDPLATTCHLLYNRRPRAPPPNGAKKHHSIEHGGIIDYEVTLVQMDELNARSILTDSCFFYFHTGPAVPGASSDKKQEEEGTTAQLLDLFLIGIGSHSYGTMLDGATVVLGQTGCLSCTLIHIVYLADGIRRLFCAINVASIRSADSALQLKQAAAHHQLTQAHSSISVIPIHLRTIPVRSGWSSFLASFPRRLLHVCHCTAPFLHHSTFRLKHPSAFLKAIS